MRKNTKIIVKIIFVLAIIINLIGERGTVVEEINLPNSIGHDIEKGKGNEILHKISLRTYFSEGKLQNQSKVIIGKGMNIGETRDERQLQASKEFLLGLEKALVFSETNARFGVRDSIDILINNPLVNDNAKMVVCNGEAKDILEYEVKKYGGTEEYIGSLVEHSKNFNFFSNKYNLMNFIMESTSEGKNSVLPYIDIVEDNLKITGLAIFNKDKMIAKMDIKNAKILNLLRENNVKGVLSIQKNSKEYINYFPTSKRKVKCYKEGDKYKFVIDINLKGPIISNELYKNLDNDPRVLKQFEKEMEENVEKKCELFISKMREQCKIDVLQLGSVASAKYGKGLGIDWNEKVLNSEIKVNVKVKVDSQGRGEYK